MKLQIHRAAATMAFTCITIFFLSTVLAELWGSKEDIVKIKSYIVMPGLFVLIPSIALAGCTGYLLSKGRGGKIIARKKTRMRFIALNGLLILLPAAITLNSLAANGEFNTTFYSIQIAELLAGSMNIVLMALSFRDGRRITAARANEGRT